MKKLILLITVLSLTSCSLFKKSVKTSNSSEQVSKMEVKSETNEHVKTEIKGESSVRSVEQNQVKKDIDEHTSVSADEIEVKPDGTILGKGNAKFVNNLKDRSKSYQNKASKGTDRYIGQSDVTKENEAQGKQENKSQVKDTQTKTEPKITFAFGFFVIIVIIFLLVFLVKKMIKSNIFTKIFTKLKL